MKKTWMLSIIVTIIVSGVFLGSLSNVPIATSAPLGQSLAWVTTTPLIEPLAYHGAVTESQKKYIYISGGNKNPVNTNIIQTVRFATIQNNGIGPWNAVKELPIRLFQHAMVAVGNYLYVIGGWDGGKARANVFRATVPDDGKITEWVPLADYSSPINFHEAAVVNNFIYVIGGRINNDVRTSEVRYASVNPATGDLGSWTPVQMNLPNVVSASAVAAYNGYLYVTGGFNGTNALDTVYYAKVNSDGNITTPWKPNPFAPASARYFHEAVVIDGKLFILGGTDGTTEKSDVWAAQINDDGSLGTWEQQANLNESLQQFASVSVDQEDGRFLGIVLGGRHGAEFSNQVYVLSYTRPTPTMTPTPTATVTPTPTPGLQVFLSNQPPPFVSVGNGGVITYTITYSTANYRPAVNTPFANVVITNVIPVVSKTPLAVTTISTGGQKTDRAVVWQIGDITTTVNKTVSYTVMLPPSFSLPTITPTAPAMPPLVRNDGVTLTWGVLNQAKIITSTITFNNSPFNLLPLIHNESIGTQKAE